MKIAALIIVIALIAYLAIPDAWIKKSKFLTYLLLAEKKYVDRRVEKMKGL